MKPCKGNIVKSLAGHDKDTFYVVVDVYMEKSIKYVLLVDGKYHKLNTPKKKNIIHISTTNDVIDLQKILTDRKVRRILWHRNFS